MARVADPRRAADLPRLMLVTDRRRVRGRDLVRSVTQAVAGGVDLVQLREKDLPDDALRELLLRVRAALPRAATLLVNGRERVAATLGAGLHLPAQAPPPTLDERHFPLLGRSAHDVAEAQRAAEQGVDYVLLGTIYRTASKPGRPASGAELVREVSRRLAPLPVFAIGGVTVARVPELLRAGAHGVAVCGAILSANEPRRVAEALTLALGVAGRGAGERDRP